MYYKRRLLFNKVILNKVDIILIQWVIRLTTNLDESEDTRFKS